MSTGVQIDTLLTATHLAQDELDRGHWTDLASDIQEYHILDHMLMEERVGFQSGNAIEGTVMTTDNGSARWVGLYAEDTWLDVDGSEKFSVPWRHMDFSWSYDRRQVKMNRSPAKIVDLVSFKRAQAYLSAAKKLEDAGWSLPNGPSDNLPMFGIPYWIVKNATKGFNGGNPAGFSAGAGGLDSTAYPSWQNYTFTYQNITFDDCIAEWREAAQRCKWKSPKKMGVPAGRRGKKRYSYCMNLYTRQQFERQAHNQNDNVGNDLATYDGETYFNRVPLDWIPQLDSDTDNPVYGIDWSNLYFVFLEDEYLVEDKAIILPNHRSVIGAKIYLTCNTRCTNRRTQFVGYQVA